MATPRRVPIDELIDVIWGERPPATARKMLQKYVWTLRTAIGDDAVVTEGDGYALAVDPDDIDSGRFERLVGQAGEARKLRDFAVAWELLADAMAMWRGRPFAGHDDLPPIADERRRLEEIHLLASEEQVHVGLELGKHDLLLPRIQEMASQHPLREGLCQALMLALYRSGRHADALAASDRLRRTLGEELGLEPSPQLAELEQRILEHDPALRPRAPASAGNLPARLTSFVGRTAELSEVARLVTSTRLVSLVGSAGAGKTRLALESAEAVADRFPDGVWLVDLAATAIAEHVDDACAAALRLQPEPGLPTRAAIKDYLGGRTLLLVMDNCEHVSEGVAALVADMLASHHHVHVLATSREPIGVTGEHTFGVAPLACPEVGDEIGTFDAVQLFVERAQAADPNFVLDGSSGDAVAQICRRLDGLPLAIEIVAAKAHSLPPAQLSRHLGERFDLLALPGRTTDRRHQTLRAAIDWSYDALDIRGQALLRRLSVFRGGFDLEAAQRVCAFPPIEPNQVLAHLSGLVDKSLVVIDHRPTTGVRYRLLETLREYGVEHRDSDEDATVRAAHAAYFCDVAERAAVQLRGPRQGAWLRRLDVNGDNLREALRCSVADSPETAIRLAVALADYWDSLGSREDGQTWLEQAVNLSDSASPQLAIAARVAAADLFVSTHLSHSVRYANEALDAARRIGDETAEAKALRALALAQGLHEDHDETQRVGGQALAIFERLGATWETALCLERLGQPTYPDPRIAHRYLERSLALYRQAGDRRRQAVVLYKLAARSAQALGNLDTARAWVEESLAIFDEVGSPQDAAHASLEYGKILRRQRHFDRAEDVLVDAVERLRAVGDLRCTIRALTALGIARAETDDPSGAAAALRTGIELGRSLDEPQTLRAALAGMARVMSSSGELAEAVALYGFVDRLGRDYAVPVSADSRTKRDIQYEQLAAALGVIEFDRAWKLGEAMGFEEALTLALQDPAG